ncbi:DUF6919 domain-containing protein [Actinacidiphila glaucinigra]|uniref:DUF6919 domain-containing protein n=1 Tax=Actinacidiphila glaucinigra TaxID=235986 RepID=UPI0036B91608
MKIRPPWMNRADRRRWREAVDLEDLGTLMALWLEGEIASWPGYQPGYGPDEETTALVPTLAACCRAGYVTIGSQPGIDPGPGYDGATWMQRAAVEGFVCDPLLLEHMVSAADEAGLEMELTDPRDDDATGIVVTLRDGQPYTAFGGALSRGTLKRSIWPGIGAGALDQVLHAVRITLAAPEYGAAAGVQLWDVLDVVAGRVEPEEPRCVRCGCTENKACPGGCWWVPNESMQDLCSACVYV